MLGGKESQCQKTNTKQTRSRQTGPKNLPILSRDLGGAVGVAHCHRMVVKLQLETPSETLDKTDKPNDVTLVLVFHAIPGGQPSSANHRSVYRNSGLPPAHQFSDRLENDKIIQNRNPNSRRSRRNCSDRSIRLRGSEIMRRGGRPTLRQGLDREVRDTPIDIASPTLYISLNSSAKCIGLPDRAQNRR